MIDNSETVEKKSTITSETYDFALQRGIFKSSSGASFKVRPIAAAEFDAYYPFIVLIQTFKNKVLDIENDKENLGVSYKLLALFTNAFYSKDDVINLANNKFKTKYNAIINWLCEHIFKGYKRYRRFEKGKILAKAFETLVTDNRGKKITFHDLQVKHLMPKYEIVQLAIYIGELSNFI